MNMRVIIALLILGLLSALCCQVYAAGTTAPRNLPTMGGASRPTMAAFVRPLPIGPTDSTGAPRIISGKIALIARPPRDVQPATVEMFVDGRSLGTSGTKPYKVEVDTASIGEGEHTLKAVGRDQGGKEIWAASVKVQVRNSGPAAGAPEAGPVPPPASISESGSSAEAPPPPPAPPAEETEEPPAAPVIPMIPDNTNVPKAIAPAPPVPEQPSPVAAPAAAKSVKLAKTYASARFGFSICHPTGWAAKDQSAKMKPKSVGGFWIAFAQPPIDTARVVVNIRRQRLAPKTDAGTFAKYNSYVRGWEQKTVMGSSAFATTSQLGGGRTIHRLIIIKPGFAWMLNCTDKSGKPAEESAALFEAMAGSLEIK